MATFDVKKTVSKTTYKKIADCLVGVLGKEYDESRLSQVARNIGLTVCGQSTLSVVAAIREALAEPDPGPPLKKTKVDEVKKRSKVELDKESK